MIGWRYYLLGLVVVLTSCTVAGTQAPPGLDRSAQPDRLPAAVVALGDSFMAGEGAGDYRPGTAGQGSHFCHRSRHAIVAQVELSPTSPAQPERINLACSGADAADVAFGGPVSQAARLHRVALRHQVEVVLITVGANGAARFSELFRNCALAWMWSFGPSCSSELTPVWRQRMTTMSARVGDALRDVRHAMRNAGYSRGEYALVATSYPMPVAKGMASSLRDLSGCPFRPEDLAWLRTQAVPGLAAALHEAARSAGARFLDLTHAAAGHEACSSTSTPGWEWINRLRVDFGLLRDQDTARHAMAESFHPDATGYSRIARCLGEFLRSELRAATCRVDRHELVSPVALPAPSSGGAEMGSASRKRGTPRG